MRKTSKNLHKLSHFFPLIFEFHQVTDLGANYPNGYTCFKQKKITKFGVDTFNFKRHIFM